MVLRCKTKAQHWRKGMNKADKQQFTKQAEDAAAVNAVSADGII